MARTVILGAGFSGQYAAIILRDALKGKGDHQVTVVNPYPKFTYVPSLVWVGIGQIKPDAAQFELAPVYDRAGIEFIQGMAREVHPDENYLLVDAEGKQIRVDYDYLINATGPYLNFDATPGLGPEKGHTHSICTPPHAVETAAAYMELVEKLKKGGRARIVIGTGHGTCTCQGAAFEYICLMHNSLKDHGVRDRVELRWVSNEPAPGDFGIDGFEIQLGSILMTSRDMCGAIFKDYDIAWDVKSHVHEVDDKAIHTENDEGEFKEYDYDFAMLIPPFRGRPIKYLNKEGEDLSDTLLNQAGFFKVDAVYGKPYEDLEPADWPSTYQTQTDKNMFGVGIAFAPPGWMSQPSKAPSGKPIAAAIPRTGYTSELTGKAAALNVAEMIEGREPSHTASLAETAGMCIASMKNSWTSGQAAVIGIHPIVRNTTKYPNYGRKLDASALEMGQAGAWLKKGLHYGFLYKLSAKPFWKYIP